MNCPTCQTAMQSGTASVELSTLGKVVEVVNLLNVMSGHYVADQPHYIYFRQGGTGEAVCVDHSHQAHYCPQCHTLVVTPTART